MDVIKIPFVEKVGIIRQPDGMLELPIDESVHNHLKSIHASAQFALAETASGEILQTLFPEFVDKVIPVLRDSNIKFKKPAQKSISTRAYVSDDAIEKFKQQLTKKGRSSIIVNVEVKDYEGVVTSIGVFNWYVQRIA